MQENDSTVSSLKHWLQKLTVKEAKHPFCMMVGGPGGSVLSTKYTGIIANCTVAVRPIPHKLAGSRIPQKHCSQSLCIVTESA